MDTTWEHRWKMVKNKDRHQAKGHIFEAGIPFLWHSNFDWDITIWTTCSSFLLIESWLPYIFGRHFRKHGTISSSGFDWATIPERRQDFRSPYTHFTYGPWTINVFNRQSTVTQYESFIDVIYIYIYIYLNSNLIDFHDLSIWATFHSYVEIVPDANSKLTSWKPAPLERHHKPRALRGYLGWSKHPSYLKWWSSHKYTHIYIYIVLY